MNRRKFIEKSLIGTMAVMPYFNSYGNATSNQKLIILHTNDVHSRIEPFPDTDKKYAGMGGVAMRKQIIETIRNQNEQVLLLDAGDIFQGTPYFNFFKGSVEIEMMNEMGYDCATIGNHDFDGGIANLAAQIDRANFPFVNCNYDFTNTVLHKKVHKHIVLKKGKLKIGITGCGVALEGLVPNQLCKGVIYSDPVACIQQEVDNLQAKKVDYIIVLSHLGYNYQSNKISDVKLAQQTKDIDIIIGGHTHTFLPEPNSQKNKINQEVIINQVGWGGIQLGKLELSFNKISRKKLLKYHTVIVDKKTIGK